MRFTLNRIKTLIKKALEEPPTGNDWLDRRYNAQTVFVGHPQPYYRLFYLLAEALKPGVVVELGGWQGTAAAHFAAGHPEAKVITIDHHKDPGDEYNQQKMLEVVHHFPNVTYLQGWTTPGYAEEYPEKGAVSVLEDVKEILDGDKIDILFIDSWHEGRYFKRDWDHYQPLLASPALVICDDVYNAGHFVDMVETFEALPGQKMLNDEVHRDIPMGFIKYGSKTTRKPSKKRNTARKAA